MHWKLKAAIQNAVAFLPASISYAVYYAMQRRWGSLKNLNPSSRLAAGIGIWNRIRLQGYDPTGRVFFELGTGRVPLAPLAYWLMGAEKTITLDINPYVKAELVVDSLRYIANGNQQIRALFGPLLHNKRFDDLVAFSQGPGFSLTDFLKLCRIEYIAPGYAEKTNLPSESIDFHTSHTVIEHISPGTLRVMLEEGNRIVKPNGLFVHGVDYSDHFSHSDGHISPINFLRYSNDEWRRYARNQYMYVNRIRHDDIIALLQSVGHEILATELDIDQQTYRFLADGNFQLDARFNTKSLETLSTLAAWITSRKRV